MAVAAAVAWWWLARRERAIVPDLSAAWSFLDRHATRIIAVVALISAIVAAAFATESAAGADASGYISEASAWMRSVPPTHVEILAQEFPELDGWITTPLGWRPADGCDGCDGVQVPTYPPGLPLLMAIPHAMAGVTGASAVVVAASAIAVWATGMLAGGVAGILAAILIAFSPAFLHHAIQPMSDVPVTAAWMTCFLLGSRQRSLGAGVACAVAVLIRPNLAPLAVIPLLIAHRRFTFAWPVAIAGIFLAFVQMFWYGSPWRSGYGSADELFAVANIVPNASRYFSWLITTAPLLLVSIAGFIRLRRQRITQALVAFVVLVVAAYLVYAVFDDWSYLRFLLPALAVLAVYTGIELNARLTRAPMVARAPLLLAVVLVIVGFGLWKARSKDTFRLASQLGRVAEVADYINADVPPAAVIVAGEQSGSMRYYADRPILRWEAATPESLNAAMLALAHARRPVYIVLDAWEDPLFRAKFANVPAGALDWPAMLEAGTSHRTRLWKLTDRDKFVAGEHVNTIRLP